MAADGVYEVFAVRYASFAGRRRHENFIAADPHDGPMPIDYYVWAIKGTDRTFVVDLGFDGREAEARQRSLLRCPTEGLRAVGVEAGTVHDVIVTHLHYDHAGNVEKFPEARMHLQEAEMTYATGRHMNLAPLSRAYAAEYVVDMVRALFAGRVVFHDGEAELAPGLSLHRIGGHTMGLQVVRVRTRRGWVVLASDASHYYENMETTKPFPIVFNLGEMVAGYEKMRQLAESPEHIVPGHDPLVMTRYPAPSTATEGIAVRLDVPPKSED